MYHLNTRPSYNHNGKQACMHHVCTHAKSHRVMFHQLCQLPGAMKKTANPHHTFPAVPRPLLFPAFPFIIPPSPYPNHPTQHQIHPRTYLLTLHCLCCSDRNGKMVGKRYTAGGEEDPIYLGHRGLEIPRWLAGRL